MCYAFSLLEPDAIAFRYSARFPSNWEYQPMYYLNAFSLPDYPVLSNNEPDEFSIMKWGLIPFWVKTEEDAEKMRTRTLNARSETLFEKPSFKFSIIKRRCLIPADGFFEWRHFLGNNYPYYIFLKDHEIFSFAGIYEKWVHPESSEEVYGFSIITCDANPLLAKIHNKKKRMPVILSKESEMDWLKPDLSESEIKDFLKPYPEDKMKAYTISKRVSNPKKERNIKEVIEPFEYVDLPLL